MGRRCAVCAAPDGNAGRTRGLARLRRVLLDSRLISLCETHAQLVLDSGVTTFAELRDRFRESTGRRSLLDRRDSLDRRAFPPRPEGRRTAPDRRATLGHR